LKRCLLVLFSFLFFLISCGTEDITSDHTERQRLLVEHEKITRSSIKQTVELSGQLLPKTQIPLVIALPLEVKDVHVDIGQTVSKGDLLLTLDDEAANRQLSQAKRVLDQLNQSLVQANELNRSVESNVNNLQELQKELQNSVNRSRNIIDELNKEEIESSLIDLLRASLDVSLKQAELAQAASSGTLMPINTIELEVQIQNAEQAVHQAEEAVKSTKLHAPISGIISQLDVTIGQTAIPSQPLLMISDLLEVDAAFPANSFQIAKLSSGLTATLSIAGITDSVTSKIATISPVINPQTNTFTVHIPLPNESLQFKGGMRTTAVIDLNTASEVLVIPANAVLFEDGQPYTFVVEGTTVKRQELELGYREGDLIEVITGVNEDDQVVTSGKERLTEGAEITIRNE
jgi:RND family efflux transporter MFP subunit